MLSNAQHYAPWEATLYSVTLSYWVISVFGIMLYGLVFVRLETVLSNSPQEVLIFLLQGAVAIVVITFWGSIFLLLPLLVLTCLLVPLLRSFVKVYLPISLRTCVIFGMIISGSLGLLSNLIAFSLSSFLGLSALLLFILGGALAGFFFHRFDQGKWWS